MDILIVAEKPAITRHLAPFARERWPDADITFVHAVPYGNFNFSYPRGLRMQDFPAIAEPLHRLQAWDAWSCPPLRLLADGSLGPAAMSDALFQDADLIVSACDPDHTGAVSFDLLLQHVFKGSRVVNCQALYLVALDAGATRKALADMRPVGELFADSVAYGRLKRFFDWNWNHNSLVVLGDAQRRAGVSVDAPPLSKYALQLLYCLRGQAPMAEGDLIQRMAHWKGTGRYSGAQAAPLGSAASRAAIIENLLQAKLLDALPHGQRIQLSLSDLGLELLAQLHPDCEDSDLPFRLHAWCQAGEAAKPAVARYIRTFFGKQLRFRAS